MYGWIPGLTRYLRKLFRKSRKQARHRLRSWLAGRRCLLADRVGVSLSPRGCSGATSDGASFAGAVYFAICCSGAAAGDALAVSLRSPDVEPEVSGAPAVAAVPAADRGHGRLSKRELKKLRFDFK
ncbi:hypothetical protein RY831_02535 [Noviherbaspirillum sp. CPCC 100848]|uniref:Uncharacterized protein n=1 Tax=Noviherbaspirillum album TaxID=3080276 RepID=A0ABU6J3R6_9BURK|nr:hypothetical protein [Noviherbaspirillum sp. CPCC 100848]MEC4718015.1 hypothetical protein [Noviherbaspirillum sp. CPCC 100848]